MLSNPTPAIAIAMKCQARTLILDARRKHWDVRCGRSMPCGAKHKRLLLVVGRSARSPPGWLECCIMLQKGPQFACMQAEGATVTTTPSDMLEADPLSYA